MQNNWKWDLIANAIIISWFMEIFGEKTVLSFIIFIVIGIPIIIVLMLVAVCMADVDNPLYIADKIDTDYTEVKVIDSSPEIYSGEYSELYWKKYYGENINKEESTPVKAGKEIWEERKIEIEKEDEREKEEKVKKQVEEWMEEAKSKQK